MPRQTVPERQTTSRGRRAAGRRAQPVPPSAATGPVAVKVHPRPGLLGTRLQLSQLVLIEVGLALVALGYAIKPALAGVFAVPAVVLVLAALVPLNGRSMMDGMRVRGAYNARRKQAQHNVPPPGTDPALAPALELEPALRTATHATETDLGSGRPLRRETGIIGDGTFLTSVLLVQAKDQPLRPARNAAPLPLDVICSALRVDDISLESVQLVQHTQPSPAPHLPEQSLAVRAYHQLPDGLATPALRLTWVALKFNAEQSATAVAARGGGEEGARKALQRVTDQLAGRLNAAGFTATVLDERELIAALAISICANPMAVAGRQGTSSSGGVGARRTQESGKFWRIDDRWHSTYWISKWPQLSRPGGAPGRIAVPDLVNAVTGTPALASTFSLTARRGTGGATAISGHVRVTGRSENEVTQVGRLMESRAAGAGLELTRLDLEQAPGLLATLPLGGTA